MEWKNLGKSLRKHGLTEKECEVSILSLQNLSIAEISIRTGLKPKTVSWYLKNSYKKMKAETRNEFFLLCEKSIEAVEDSIQLETAERNNYLDNHLRDAGFSKSEISVGLLLAQGLSTKEIAEKLFVAEKSVKFHCTNFYVKLGVKTRAQFIVKCFDLIGVSWENRLASPNFLHGNEPLFVPPAQKAQDGLPVGIQG